MPIDMDGSTEILERRRWAKDIPGDTPADRWRLVVTGELVTRKGNADPYFSITGEVVNRRARKGSPAWDIMGGCIHDVILDHYPELAPLVAVHLATPGGTPMHAEANALYWAGLCRWGDMRAMSPGTDSGRIPVETDSHNREWSPAMLAKHLNIPEQEARELRHRVAAKPVDHQQGAMADECSALAGRWAKSHDEAMRLLQQDDDIARTGGGAYSDRIYGGQ